MPFVRLTMGAVGYYKKSRKQTDNARGSTDIIFFASTTMFQYTHVYIVYIYIYTYCIYIKCMCLSKLDLKKKKGHWVYRLNETWSLYYVAMHYAQLGLAFVSDALLTFPTFPPSHPPNVRRGERKIFCVAMYIFCIFLLLISLEEEDKKKKKKEAPHLLSFSKSRKGHLLTQ